MMNSYAGEAGISNEATSSSLTWQQQLMNDSSSSRKTRKEPHTREKREAKPRKPKSDKSGSVDTLKNRTWQQELFHQAQPRKSAYDFAVDARDRETFGEGSSRSKNAANMQETRKKKGKTRVLMKTPKTPNQDVTTTMAYAGPTFHNSPHAASLPAPTFQGKSKLGFANEKDSSSDLSESDTDENSVTPLPTNSKAVPENPSETIPATQKPLNTPQTGQRSGLNPHVRQPMELLQQAFANHAQSSNAYHQSVPATNVSHHRAVPSPSPSPASNRPYPSTFNPSGYSSRPDSSMQNGNYHHAGTSLMTQDSSANQSSVHVHPMPTRGPNQAMTPQHDKDAHFSIPESGPTRQYRPSSSMQPTSITNSASNNFTPMRPEATSRTGTPTTQFQSVDNLLSEMLNSSSLLRR